MHMYFRLDSKLEEIYLQFKLKKVQPFLYIISNFIRIFIRFELNLLIR